MEVYIGLDVHCKETVYVAMDSAGKILREGRIPTSYEGFCEMLGKIEVPHRTKIALETGTQSTWVSRLLSDLMMEPVVVEAREVRAKARRVGQKSDRRDAFEICDGLRRGLYTSIVYVPNEEVQRLRNLLSRRRHFVRLYTGQISAAKYLLRSVGLQGEAASLKTGVAWERLLDRPAVVSLRPYLVMHAQIWQTAKRNVLELEKELSEALAPFAETMRSLQTVPGIGFITAATYLATLGTPHRFAESGKVISYIGLAVSTYDSGERERHGHITKRGSSELRAMLCQAAHHAADPEHPLNPYFARLCARGGYKKAVIAVAQRMARILYQMWRKQEDFDPTQLNVVFDKRQKTKTVFWRIRKEKDSAAA